MTYELTSSERRTRTVISVGAALLLLSGLASIVFAVAGLVSPMPFEMAAAATLAAGAALIFQGASVAVRWTRATHVVGRERADILGVTAEIVGGVVSVGLALLAFRYAPATLLAIAAGALGVALLLSGRTQSDLVWLAPTTESNREVSRELERSSDTVMSGGGVVALLCVGLAVSSGSALALAAAMVAASIALMFVGGAQLARFTRTV